jgi:hypothetical protein
MSGTARAESEPEPGVFTKHRDREGIVLVMYLHFSPHKPPINPNPRQSQGYVDPYSALPWVTWEAVTGVERLH